MGRPRDRRARLASRRRRRPLAVSLTAAEHAKDRRRHARRARHPRRYRTHARSGPPPLSASSLTYLAALLRPTPAAAVPVLVLPLWSLDLLDPPYLPNLTSPVYHQPSFLFGPRPRSRTLMVRGRGRGPNRPPTPVSIGQLHRRPRIRNPGSSPGVNPHPERRTRRCRVSSNSHVSAPSSEVGDDSFRQGATVARCASAARPERMPHGRRRRRPQSRRERKRRRHDSLK